MSKDKKNTIETKEIQKQAKVLFSLIADHLEEHGDDTIAETLAEEMGDFLKSAKGFDLLQYAFDLTQTKSEEATEGFDWIINRLKDEDLSNLYRVLLSAVDMVEIIESDDLNQHKLCFRMQVDKELAPELGDCIASEWHYRAKYYREEIYLRMRISLRVDPDRYRKEMKYHLETLRKAGMINTPPDGPVEYGMRDPRDWANRPWRFQPN